MISSSTKSAFSALLYSVVADVVLVSVALLVGYTFRQRFDYSLRGIFLTCVASSFLIILAISLAMAIPEAFDTKVISNSTLFLFSAFASSAVEGALVAALITAGAAVGGGHRRRSPSRQACFGSCDDAWAQHMGCIHRGSEGRRLRQGGSWCS